MGKVYMFPGEFARVLEAHDRSTVKVGGKPMSPDERLACKIGWVAALETVSRSVYFVEWSIGDKVAFRTFLMKLGEQVNEVKL